MREACRDDLLPVLDQLLHLASLTISAQQR
jgi:hypothetical protein